MLRFKNRSMSPVGYLGQDESIKVLQPIFHLAENILLRVRGAQSPPALSFQREIRHSMAPCAFGGLGDNRLRAA